jgi:hypothetical protein
MEGKVSLDVDSRRRMAIKLQLSIRDSATKMRPTFVERIANFS